MNKALLHLLTWVILLIIAILLWYRNEFYDRVMGVFIFTLGIYQLLLYGMENQMDKIKGEKMILISCWLQCLILAIAVYLFFNSSHFKNSTTDIKLISVCKNISLIFMIIYCVIFLLALLYITTYSTKLFEKLKDGKMHDILSKQTMWIVIYMIGIIFPFLLLLVAYKFNILSLYILLIYIIISFVIGLYKPYSQTVSYLMTGFAFLVWILGFSYPETRGTK